jgi:hypothetical protein
MRKSSMMMKIDRQRRLVERRTLSMRCVRQEQVLEPRSRKTTLPGNLKLKVVSNLMMMKMRMSGKMRMKMKKVKMELMLTKTKKRAVIITFDNNGYFSPQSYSLTTIS